MCGCVYVPVILCVCVFVCWRMSMYVSDFSVCAKMCVFPLVYVCPTQMERPPLPLAPRPEVMGGYTQLPLPGSDEYSQQHAPIP